MTNQKTESETPALRQNNNLWLLASRRIDEKEVVGVSRRRMVMNRNTVQYDAAITKHAQPWFIPWVIPQLPAGCRVLDLQYRA